MNWLLKLSFLIFVIATSGALAQWPLARVTIQVVDENGSPLRDAEASISFEIPTHKPGSWGSSPVQTKRGKTNLEGLFSATENGGTHVSYGAGAPGYYSNKGSSIDFEKSEDGKWRPWNPTLVLTLRRMIHPVPMYAKRLETKLPIDAWPVGFDLVEADWVSPYGKGKISDFVFEVKRVIRAPRDFDAELKLTFSNKGDGISNVPRELQNMASELRLPHNAPETGYLPERVWQLDSSNRRSHEPTDKQSYFYRVRTVLDDSGRVVTALYGKIYGDISLSVGTQAPKAGLGFTYYLNASPNDRNTEFDPQRNLFTNFKFEERVTAP